MSGNNSTRPALTHGSAAPMASRIGQGRSAPASSSSQSSSTGSMRKQKLPSTTIAAAQKAPSALPRFMQPTTSSKQSAAASQQTTSAQSAPPQSGHLAVTPAFNISAKPSPPEPSSTSSSSKWKSSAGNGPVFSVISRGSRQPTKQPLQPTKAHPTASRISRPSPACTSTPQHSINSSLSLRSSSASSNRTPSTCGAPNSSAASTPVLSSKQLGPQHAHRDSISSCCSTFSAVPACSSASTHPRSKNCKSLVRALTFDDEQDCASSCSAQTSASTALKPSARNAGSTMSRIPAAPGASAASAGHAGSFPAGSRTAGSAQGMHACVSTGGVRGAAGNLHDAGSAGASLAAHGDAALDLLSQHATSQDSTWLSDGSSEEGLQQLAGGACVLGGDALGGLERSGSSGVGSGAVKAAAGITEGQAAGSKGATGAPAAAAGGAAKSVGGKGEPAAAVGDAKPVPAGTHCAEGNRRRTWVMRGCMLLVWSVLLLFIGFLAAAVLVVLQEPRPAKSHSYVHLAFDDSDIGVLAGVGRRYAV